LNSLLISQKTKKREIQANARVGGVLRKLGGENDGKRLGSTQQYCDKRHRVNLVQGNQVGDMYCKYTKGEKRVITTDKRPWGVFLAGDGRVMGLKTRGICASGLGCVERRTKKSDAVKNQVHCGGGCRGGLWRLGIGV